MEGFCQIIIRRGIIVIQYHYTVFYAIPCHCQSLKYYLHISYIHTVCMHDHKIKPSKLLHVYMHAAHQ